MNRYKLIFVYTATLILSAIGGIFLHDMPPSILLFFVSIVIMFNVTDYKTYPNLAKIHTLSILFSFWITLSISTLLRYKVLTVGDSIYNLILTCAVLSAVSLLVTTFLYIYRVTEKADADIQSGS